MNNDKSGSHEREHIPSHYRIFDYWKDKSITADGNVLTGSLYGEEVITDWGEPSCWACGRTIDLGKYETYDDNLLNTRFSKIYGYAKVKDKLQRCHIVAHSLGGKDDEPSNYFLMCKRCHDESPDTADEKNFFRWVYGMKRKCMLGDKARQLLKAVQEECEAQNKSVNDVSIENLTEVARHGNGISESSMVYAIVDSCRTLSNKAVI